MRARGENDSSRYAIDPDSQSEANTATPTPNLIPLQHNVLAEQNPARTTDLDSSVLPSWTHLPSQRFLIDLAHEVEQVQLPWVVRVATDERSFLYFNINTQDILYDQPSDALPGGSQSHARSPLINPADLELLCQQLDAPGKSTVPYLAYARAATTTTFHTPYDTASHSHLPDASAPPPPTDPIARHVPEPCYTTPPPSLVRSQQTSRALQQLLACGDTTASGSECGDLVDLEDRFTILTDYQEAMAQSMNWLVMAVSDYGRIQLTWSTKGYAIPPAEEASRMIAASLTLEQSVNEVVQAMARVLYASGGIQYLPEHLLHPTSTALHHQGSTVGRSRSARSSSILVPSRQQSMTSSILSYDSTSANCQVASTHASTYATSFPPPTIASASRRLSSYLAALVLSAHMLLELYRAEAYPAPPRDPPVQPQSDTSTAVAVASAEHACNTRVELAKQKVRQDATDLLRSASTLSAELDTLRAMTAARARAAASSTNDNDAGSSGEPSSGQQPADGVHPITWPHRIGGKLVSGDAEAGVGYAAVLSGGSAAGWHGNGFVLPSSEQMLALRMEDGNHTFVNPFDPALSSGLEVLGRSPTQTLQSSAPILRAVRTQAQTLRSNVLGFRHLVHQQVGSCGDLSLLLDSATKLVARGGTYVTVLEDLDLASSLDYDSAGDDEGELMGQMTQRATDLTTHFVQVKQDLYDELSSVFVQVQDTLMVTMEGQDEEAPALTSDGVDRLSTMADTLLDITQSIDSLLFALTTLTDQQQRTCRGSPTLRGARARVYMTEQLPAQPFGARPIPYRAMSSTSVSPTSSYVPPAPTSTSQIKPISVGPRQATKPAPGMMYLGPGIVVPDGPPQLGSPSSEAASPVLPPSSTDRPIQNGGSSMSSTAILTPSGQSRAGGRPTSASISSAPPHSGSSSTKSFRGRSASAALTTLHNLASRRNTGMGTGNTNTSSTTNNHSPSMAYSTSTLASTKSASPSRSSTFGPSSSDDLVPDRAGSVGARTDKVRRMLGDELPINQPTPPSTPGADPPLPSTATRTIGAHSPTLAPLGSSSGSTSPTTTPTTVPPRDQQQRSWFLDSGINPNDIAFTLQGYVKGATLEALMVRLTIHDNFDLSFNNTFLLTYRSFTTTEVFLDLLMERFRVRMPFGLSPPEQHLWSEKMQRPIQLRVFNTLKSWLETYHHPTRDRPYFGRIRGFATEEMAVLPSMKLASTQLLRLIDKREQGNDPGMPRRMLGGIPPPSIPPKNPRKIKLLELDPLEVARQLTLWESDIFSSIKPFECLSKAWMGDGGEKRAPNVKAMIQQSNDLSRWVISSILEQLDVKKRAGMIRQWILIADKARQLQNFASMVTITSSLSSNSAIRRLRKSFGFVGVAEQLLEQLNNLVFDSKNFSSYRHLIHNLNPPCVPFLGVYLTDLVFIDDGNKDFLADTPHMINFAKRHKTAEVVKEIMIYQSTPFNLNRVPSIAKYISDCLHREPLYGDDYKRSLALEPREDPNMTQLLHDTALI